MPLLMIFHDRAFSLQVAEDDYRQNDDSFLAKIFGYFLLIFRARYDFYTANIQNHRIYSIKNLYLYKPSNTIDALILAPDL